MIDKATEELLHQIHQRCKKPDFFREYADLCLTARLALLNVRGGAVRLRTSLLKVSNLSEAKTAFYVLRDVMKLVGPMPDGRSLKMAAVTLFFKKLKRYVGHEVH